jgi:hypothetical protein
VFSAPLPVATPYFIAGWGTYGLGGDGPTSGTTGWNVGAGVRVSVPGAPGFFGEIRRHERVSRDLITFGVRF